jgi:nicotinate-nucleotide adenylyltransferase
MGGTFDPIHMGHLIAAEEARWRLKLDHVLFIPAGQPWLKAARSVSSVEDRREMVRLAITDYQKFKLSTVELDRPGPSYAADTIGLLRGELGPGAKLFFILGWDSLAELPHWKDPGRLIASCKLVVVPRTDCPAPDMASLEAKIPGLARSTIRLTMPLIGINSTDIRRRVTGGQSIKYLVPQAVERYIQKHRLYLS